MGVYLCRVRCLKEDSFRGWTVNEIGITSPHGNCYTMGMIQELMSSIIGLITKPFWLFKMVCSLGFHTFFLIGKSWMDVVRVIIGLHVSMFWSMTVWGMALAMLPVRLLNALHRERQLEIHVSDLQFELGNLFWTKKELEGRLKTAINEHRMVDLVLNELEDEHDKAIDKIEELEKELNELKAENKKKNTHEEEHGQSMGIPYVIPAWKTDATGVMLQDLLKHIDARDSNKQLIPKLPEAD